MRSKSVLQIKEIKEKKQEINNLLDYFIENEILCDAYIKEIERLNKIVDYLQFELDKRNSVG